MEYNARKIFNIGIFLFFIFKIMIIQERLRIIRKDLQLNQSDFANKIGTTQSHLSKLENGTIELSIETIQSLYNALKINPTWLIVGCGEMYIPDTHITKNEICNNGILENLEITVLNEKIKFLEGQLKEQRIDFLEMIKDLSLSRDSIIKPNINRTA